MNSTVKVGLVQHACTEDRGKNLAATIAGIREAAGRGAHLILLQELHTGVYFCQTEDTKRFDLAEPSRPDNTGIGKSGQELAVVLSARCSSGARPACTIIPRSCWMPTEP
jgi:N-carbamoylputrescine amidase